MPFTLAHPAAVLPLRRVRHLRIAALIVGAVVPDVPYYLPAHLARHVPMTHVFAQSFTVDLFLGYALLASLVVLQRPLTALLSARARALCLRALLPFRRPIEWVFAAPAILLGVWTHLLWDSFTHVDGWMVHRVEVLSAPLVLGPYNGTVFHSLQYVSSVAGLSVLVLWYVRLPTPAVATGPDAVRSPAGPVLLLVMVAALLIGSVQGMQQFQHTHNIYNTLELLLINALFWFGALYLTAGIVLTLEHGEQSPGAHD